MSNPLTSDRMVDLSGFSPYTREWRVTPAQFARIQELCLEDEAWADCYLYPRVGAGEVTIKVVFP